MLESPVYREILEEGQEDGLRESVLEVLGVRFGTIPPDMKERLQQIRGKELLQGLHRKAILAESIEAFQEALSK